MILLFCLPPPIRRQKTPLKTSIYLLHCLYSSEIHVDSPKLTNNQIQDVDCVDSLCGDEYSSKLFQPFKAFFYVVIEIPVFSFTYFLHTVGCFL